MPAEPLRICEYRTVRVEWTTAVRMAIAAAADCWRVANGLPQPPLSFGGVDGCELTAQQYVGVIEAGGVCVEIYPKLDASFVGDNAVTDQRARTVMGNLLWLLEESGYGGLVDAGEASVEESPETISDLLAWLYARRLLRQLALGGPHEYMARSEDLPLVRGRIHFARQATTLFCRPDIVACDWAEFSPDTPLARLLRCATEVLLARTRLPGAAAAFRDAISILEETESVRAKEALSGATSIRWSRMNERWRGCYELAVAALSGLGRELHAGDTESFVFLLDMNFLFESYCGRWLDQKFGVAISEQMKLGNLLKMPQSCGQKPDFQWRHGGTVWVGDAKYKQRSSDNWPQIADIRQLICYGRLAEQIHAIPSRLILLYPTLNAEIPEVWTTFENQPLELRAVRVVR